MAVELTSHLAAWSRGMAHEASFLGILALPPIKQLLAAAGVVLIAYRGMQIIRGVWPRFAAVNGREGFRDDPCFGVGLVAGCFFGVLVTVSRLPLWPPESLLTTLPVALMTGGLLGLTTGVASFEIEARLHEIPPDDRTWMDGALRGALVTLCVTTGAAVMWGAAMLLAAMLFVPDWRVGLYQFILRSLGIGAALGVLSLPGGMATGIILSRGTPSFGKREDASG